MSSETLPVEMICTSGPIPFVATGRARADGDDWIIHLSQDASHLAPASHAILTFDDPTRPRIMGRVRAVKGNQVILEERIVRERERRVFPRLIAGLQIEARALLATELLAESRAWMSGSDAPRDRGDWFRPDDLMSFSVTGLRFEAPESVGAQQQLLLEVGVRNQGRWRCTARVVRTFAPPVGGDPSERQVAVEFIDVTDGLEAALADLTLSIQDRMLSR